MTENVKIQSDWQPYQSAISAPRSMSAFERVGRGSKWQFIGRLLTDLWPVRRSAFPDPASESGQAEDGPAPAVHRASRLHREGPTVRAAASR